MTRTRLRAYIATIEANRKIAPLVAANVPAQCRIDMTLPPPAWPSPRSLTRQPIRLCQSSELANRNY